MRSQAWCICRDGCCSGMQRSVDEQQYLQVIGRCMVDAVQTQDSRSICQQHHDRWLQHYKPTRCAACPTPLASAARACPEWLREQLGAAHGSYVHVRPCYLDAVAQRKQANRSSHTSDSVETEPENIPPPASTFQIDVSHCNSTFRTRPMHVHTMLTSLFAICLCTARHGWKSRHGIIYRRSCST